MDKLIIRAITKNKKAKDRYTVYYTDGSYFSVDEHEVSRRKNLKLTDQVQLLRALNQGCFLDKNEKQINFFDLPANVQAEIITTTKKAEN